MKRLMGEQQGDNSSNHIPESEGRCEEGSQSQDKTIPKTDSGIVCTNCDLPEESTKTACVKNSANSAVSTDSNTSDKDVDRTAEHNVTKSEDKSSGDTQKGKDKSTHQNTEQNQELGLGE